jgi:hypothetical protein
LSIKVEFGFYKGDDGQVQFNDITSDVASISTSRGKDPNQDTFNAATCAIRLNNESRNYDPDYPSSPYQGQIVPTGSVRVSVDDQPTFTGFITDWNFDYSPSGESIAEIVASDAFWNLNNQTLIEYEPVEELTSERILAVLLRPEAGGTAVWSASNRVISEGVATVGDYSVADGTNILSYLQQVEKSEPGRLFIDRRGRLVFRSRNNDLSNPTFEYVRDNLSTNPSLESNTNGWIGTPKDPENPAANPIERSDTLAAYSGDYYLVTNDAIASSEFDSVPNTTYTVSCYAQSVISGGNAVSISADVTGTPSSTITAPESSWERMSLTFLATGNKTKISVQAAGSAVGLFDGFLFEEAPVVDAYFDGDNDPVYNTSDPGAPDYQPERAFETYVTEWIGAE